MSAASYGGSSFGASRLVDTLAVLSVTVGALGEDGTVTAQSAHEYDPDDPVRSCAPAQPVPRAVPRRVRRCHSERPAAEHYHELHHCCGCGGCARRPTPIRAIRPGCRPCEKRYVLDGATGQRSRRSSPTGTNGSRRLGGARTDDLPSRVRRRCARAAQRLTIGCIRCLCALSPRFFVGHRAKPSCLPPPSARRDQYAVKLAELDSC